MLVLCDPVSPLLVSIILTIDKKWRLQVSKRCKRNTAVETLRNYKRHWVPTIELETLGNWRHQRLWAPDRDTGRHLRTLDNYWATGGDLWR